MRPERLVKYLSNLPPSSTVWVLGTRGRGWAAPGKIEIVTKRYITDEGDTVENSDVYITHEMGNPQTSSSDDRAKLPWWKQLISWLWKQ